MYEGYEPPLKKPLMSPKMAAVLAGLFLLFGKAIFEAVVGQFIGGFFGGRVVREVVVGKPAPVVYSRSYEPPSPTPAEKSGIITVMNSGMYYAPKYIDVGTTSVSMAMPAVRVRVPVHGTSAVLFYDDNVNNREDDPSIIDP